jgi:collagenase-like PrtC family protease
MALEKHPPTLASLAAPRGGGSVARDGPSRPIRLALGPLAYYWPRRAVLDFYAGVADAPADIVYLGETVCSRRHELRWPDWQEIATMLAHAGKDVVLSSLVLIEAEADLRLLRKLVEQSRWRVEANDMGAVRLLAQRRAPFVAGASLNVFNAQTLALLYAAGATRFVAPPELSSTALRELIAAAPAALEAELLVHGRLPLAHSARCFTARHYKLQKDACEYRCLAHPDGLALRTREGTAFLNINGVQVQSAGTYNLLAELPDVRAAGVDVMRVSPQVDGTVELIRAVRDVLDGARDAGETFARVRAHAGAPACNGFWHGRPGAEHVDAGSVA